MRGVARERNLTAALRLGADAVLDTTDFKPADLRDELRRRYGEEGDELVVTLTSFGFARGISRTADLVFDLRFLPNPFWDPVLREQTGLDSAVSGAVLSQSAATEFLDAYTRVLNVVSEGYVNEGKRYVTIGIGCTGGKHRSVAMSEALADRLRAEGIQTLVMHRDLGRE